MATNPDTEYRQVYDAIAAVAAHCDGALTLDGMGFNGQDTKFGKRIASVSFDQWTPDVKQEAARISLTYKQQILTYTGVDVSTLDVVRAANGLGTNHQARWDARGYERAAKNQDKIALRKVDVVRDLQLGGSEQKLALSFHVKDPEFQDIKSACQKLSIRRFDWDVKAWVTPVGDEAEDIILTYDFNVTDAAKALLNEARQAPEVTFQINLHEVSGRLTIGPLPYDGSRVADAQKLPGREWSPPGFYKVDVVNPAPEVLTFAEKWNLSISPDALAAIEASRKALEGQRRADLAEEDFRTMMVHVSRLRSPEQLPPAFLEVLGEVLNHNGSK